MKTLSTEHRKQLERTVVEARDVAEAGARVAFAALAVHHHEPYGHMSGEQRRLRNRLRAHARHLGDQAEPSTGGHKIDHLVHEGAEQHWQGMLFARFLAENHLLIEPDIGVAITLDECEELAKEEGLDKWALATRFAHRMLPQVFRMDHPVFDVQLAREYRLKLEGLVERLPAEMFSTTDALGWVYQFWQTKEKDAVNHSEVAIGADELSAVTQLFTEPYMVQFLLHNSLGAWWVSRHPDKACGVDLTYLRRTEDGTPAAGAFEGWPDGLSEFRLLDPCCGSGHFLVAALLMLVPMRLTLEGLNAAAAVDAVLRENLHGLELDQRCVAIAAFALALEAWRYPGAGGYRTLPKLNLAWCGQPVAGKREQWLALADGDERIEAGMAALHNTFRDAPTLGSLISPARSVSEDMLTAGFEELQPLLETALREHAGEEEYEERNIAAQGLAFASNLLTKQYDLIVTNVPYLTRSKQAPRLKEFCEDHFSAGRQDLATAFLLRLLEFVRRDCAISIVMPQNWLFLSRYKELRKLILESTTFRYIARLGPGAFGEISGEIVKAILFGFTKLHPDANAAYFGLDIDQIRGIERKSQALFSSPFKTFGQLATAGNPDSAITLEEPISSKLLETHGNAWQGIATSDVPRFQRGFWEVHTVDAKDTWHFFQSTVDRIRPFGGRSNVLYWQDGYGAIAEVCQKGATFRGKSAWGRPGVVVSQMADLPVTIYGGDKFDCNCAVITADDHREIPAIWAYCESGDYARAVRKLNRKLNVTNSQLTKIGFDISKWTSNADQRYRKGLPKPYTDDPTQWIFHGHPCGSVVWDEQRQSPAHGALRAHGSVMQVAMARLLAYHWPAENDPEMALAEEQRAWVDNAKSLCPFEDEDGIVCIPSVRGERPGGERLLQLLHAAYSEDWHDGVLTNLLAASSSASVDDWLRNHSFDEHCRLFQNRPFIWHIWDGRRRDGFHALVNYHKMTAGDGKGRRLLESLTYSYLGDWISRQQDGVKRGEGGADDRLVAALELRKRLVAILEGEPPFDLFVRWKPVEEQAIGWEPDMNDGVRLNIRPFMAGDLPGGTKGAGIMRAKPNIHWKKDRGKEPIRGQAQFPWLWKNGGFTGERINEVHLTNSAKRAAREAAGPATTRK